jgi:hypothetical protein
MAIQIKRGNEADLQIDRLQPGEPVAALDTGKSGVRGGSGMLWNATAGGGAYQAVLASEKGAANGVASLGSDRLIPLAQLQSSYSFNTILTNFGWDWTGKNSGITWGAKIGRAMIFQGWFGVTDVGNGGAMIIHLGGSLPNSEDAFACELFDVGTGKTYTLCNKAANKEGQAIYPDLVPYTSDGVIADSTMLLNHTCFFGGTYVVHD